MPQLRQNLITGDWVVIAPERSKRPNEYAQPPAAPKKPHDHCIFCVGGKVYQERLTNFENDGVYVTPNKYPAFVEDPTACSPRSFPAEDGFYRARPSTGGHDLIVIKDDVSLPNFTPAIWFNLLDMFQRRMVYFRDLCGVEAAMPIYNHKPAAGASVEHPHAQLFASNIVPNQLAREVHTAYESFEKNGVCIFCRLLEHERSTKIRVIAETEEFVAFTFYAARFPFEAWVLPKQHADRFETVKMSTIRSLGEFLSKVFSTYGARLNDPPMNFFIHSLPNSLDNADFFHWHLEIAPRLANYGGFELGAGMIIDMISPEHAAEFLREE